MNLHYVLLNVGVDRIGMALVHFLWQGTITAVLLAVVLRMLGRQSPQVRYLAAWIGLLAMTVCLPVTALLIPLTSTGDKSVENTLPTRTAPLGRPTHRTITAVRSESPRGDAAAIGSEPSKVAANDSSQRAAVAPAQNAASQPAKDARAESHPIAAAWSVAALTPRLQPILPWIVYGWLSGALAMAVWHLSGLRRMVLLTHRFTAAAPAAVERQVRRLAEKLRIRRSVTVLYSQLARVPSVIGWLRPVILLPATILAEMSVEQLEMILAHELAHIRRADYLWNLLQVVIETVLFYHPAMWWVSRQIRAERENCCDLQAVGAMGNPRAYAEALLRLAEIRCPIEDRSATLGSLAADGGSLEARIRRVLGLPNGARCGSDVCLGGVLAVLILAFVVFANLTAAAGNRADDKESSATTSEKPLSMTAQEFAKLPEKSQRDVLVRAFQQRLDLSKNLIVENDQFARGFANRNGQPGEPLKGREFRAHFRLWRLGNSFKREFEINPDRHSGRITSREIYAVNAVEGLARITQDYRGGDEIKPNGQVMYPHAVINSINGYHFWLNRQFPAAASPHAEEEEHLFCELVEQQGKFAIKAPVDGDKVLLTVPWQPHWAQKDRGTRVLTLDPQKAFLPLRIVSHCDQPAAGGYSTIHGNEKIEVLESLRVATTWMPAKTQVTSYLSLFADSVNVSEISVQRCEAGNVALADMRVPFREGMQIQDAVEGMTYTSDAEGHAAGVVLDAPNWKSDPPPGWRHGQVDEAYSLASQLTAAQRRQLADERAATSQPIDTALRICAALRKLREKIRIEAALKILRVYKVGEREGDWATAIRALVAIGRPAVPRLIGELDRTTGDKPLRALGFVLRGIGDARATPALIRTIPRLIQPPSSDYGLTVKNDPELLQFMWMNDVEHIGKTAAGPKINGLTLFMYGRPVKEVMPALQKLTGQSLGWQEIRGADLQAQGTIQQRRQRLLFLEHAKRWNDWWSKNWQNFLTDRADAQLDLTQKSIEAFAAEIAAMPTPAVPTAIPCGPRVRIDGGLAWQQFEPYLCLDVHRPPTDPGAVLKRSPKDHPSPELLAWAQREGVDLLRIEIKRPGDTKTYFGYHPVGMKVWKIDNKRLKTLEKELQTTKSLALPPLWDGPISSLDGRQGEIDQEEPATFLFITRGGSCGTLQIRSALVRESVPGTAVMSPGAVQYDYIFESDTK